MSEAENLAIKSNALADEGAMIHLCSWVEIRNLLRANASELRRLSAELAALKAAIGEPVGRLESDEFAGHVFIPKVPGDWSMLGKYLYAIPKDKP